MVKESLHSTEIDIAANKTEPVWRRLRASDALCSFCRPPGGEIDRLFWPHFPMTASSLQDEQTPRVGASSPVYDVTVKDGLEQYVSLPTGGILDLIFTNDPNIVQKVCVLPGISDHDMVTATFMLPHLIPTSQDIRTCIIEPIMMKL